jgi:hypothetical protein
MRFFLSLGLVCTLAGQDGLGHLRTILENLDALDAELASRPRAAAVPVVCSYELVAE